MIAVSLSGRIGNQLFMYAFAEAIRQRRGGKEKIIFYDESILREGWKNSLLDYNLDNVAFVHNDADRGWITKIQAFLVSRMYRLLRCKKPRKRFLFEQKMQPFWNAMGVISCINGFIDVRTPRTCNVWMRGYFQSERYFKDVAPMIREKLSRRINNLKAKDYVNEIARRNTVCISIKVEHNADNPLYDVCGKDYYTQAIQYIIEHVDNPLFFVCSDNVPYVLEHYIDADKYDYICQEKGLSVCDSLAVMGICQHYIIGNTSFGWWAQFLSDNPNKIVIAPNRWFRDESIPVDVYGENWHLIDVRNYIKETEHLFD